MESYINLSKLIKMYWGVEQININIIIFFNLFGSLILGMLLGLERTMSGRAAGLRTYGLVASASCVMTVFAGYPHYWFGGSLPLYFYPDPTRVIQGVVTGVGFLGAGVIMKDGFSISGLSTAASIWMCSAIGILVGVGFYAAAIMLTLLSVITLSLINRIEKFLPQKISYAIQINFKSGYIPTEEKLRERLFINGFVISESGINVSMREGQIIWKYTAYSISNKKPVSIVSSSNEMLSHEGIVGFDISKTRI